MTAISTPASPAQDRVAAARSAQHAWAALPVRQRLRPVRTLRHLFVTECDGLCAAVARDLGKPSEETVAGELLPLADACLFLERQAGRLLWPRRVPLGQRPRWLWGQSDTVYRRPRGVIGVIGTWNYPLFLNGVQIVQALTAGNAVLWKPSEVAPSSAAALHGLIRQAGFPEGLVQVLEATREAGRELLAAGVDHVVFTGSAATGRQIARELGERLVSSTLELSGCDAQFVLDDADVGLAARAAWFGATVNRGQTCIAVRRVFVDRSVYPAFCEALRELASAATPLRLALAPQARQAERLVSEAVKGGGRLLGQSASTPLKEPDLFTPAAVVDARPEMAICQEASFAPVLAVLPFDTPDEALAMDAECSYALGASVFTRDPGRARELASRLRSGTVAVNDVVVPTAHPATPFGGRGASGWGVTQGAEGLLEMTVPQVVSVRGGRFRPHYDLAAGKGAAGQADLVRGLLESAHAPTLAGRFGGWRRLLRGVWRSR
jgi:acyl-CoA reductase-like NAD-dependent aldehyde dehydrogenase